jgi:hypothetical protein
MCCPPGVGCSASVVPWGVTDTATAPAGTRTSPAPPMERRAFTSAPAAAVPNDVAVSIKNDGVRFRFVAPTDSRRLGSATGGPVGVERAAACTHTTVLTQ